jgi:hypothetical protein
MPADELVVDSPIVFELLALLPPSKYILTSPDSIICKNITPFKQFPFPLSNPTDFVQMLLLQLRYLEEHYNKSLLYLSLEQIVVLNDTTYLLAHLETPALASLMAPHYDQFILSYPLSLPVANDELGFMSPLCTPANITVLPFTLPRSVTAYSVGHLCRHVIAAKDRPVGSRLHYFIERCLAIATEPNLLYL